ncbi:hypothetical protein JW826_05465 [Candidatus Woesearchaeota archaeon]|nr:hypothetical protein [Candidatus Woesearchaeota archaeon]
MDNLSKANAYATAARALQEYAQTGYPLLCVQSARQELQKALGLLQQRSSGLSLDDEAALEALVQVLPEARHRDLTSDLSHHVRTLTDFMRRTSSLESRRETAFFLQALSERYKGALANSPVPGQSF